MSGQASRCLAALTSILFVASCAVGPDFQTPPVPSVSRYTVSPIAAQITAGSAENGATQTLRDGADIPADWWLLFHSPDLDSLVRDALEANPDLAATRAALKAAKADADAQRAAFFPTFSVGFDATRQQTSNILSPALSSPQDTFNLLTPQVAVSYSLDLFGGVRRAAESATATADAQKFALEAAYLALVSNVALAAFADASLTEQVAAQQEIVGSLQQTRDMMKDQEAHGAISDASLVAQETLVLQARQQLAGLQKQLAQEQDQLAALTGRLPDDYRSRVLALNDFTLPHDLPLSLPAQLVRQRPDIRIAEENLRAANAQVGVAIAAMLPGLSLTANAGSAATAIGNLFAPGNGFWTIGASLIQPIFDGGALLDKKHAADARLEQAKALYRSAVVNGFQNTADALEALLFDAQALKAAAGAEQHAARSLSQARRQLALGDIAMPGVLLAEQTHEQAQITLIQSQAARFADTVALFAALGGGWWNRDDREKKSDEN